MGAYRRPKRNHPDQMCYRCRYFWGHELDWGECSLVAECVPGDQYQSVYAYGDCFFDKSNLACQNTDENAAAFADAPTMETARGSTQTPLLQPGA